MELVFPSIYPKYEQIWKIKNVILQIVERLLLEKIFALKVVFHLFEKTKSDTDLVFFS